MKKTLTQQDQVIGAITTNGRPMNLFAIFSACDCFADKEECAQLLRRMVNRAEINMRKLPNDAHPLYATPGMDFPTVAAVAPSKPRVITSEVATTKPNAAEIETAARLAPSVPVFLAPVESTPGVDMDANTPRAPIIRRNMDYTPPSPEELDDYEADADQVLEFLRAHVTPDEFRGHLKCQMIVLTLRGQPQDLQAQQHYARALARLQ